MLGIIPNLTKEPSNLEYFLRSLVEELKTFDRPGIHLPRIDRVIHCALICITCDLPATRKVCGYLGHSAKLGCSRCLLDFGGGKTKDVGGGWCKTLWDKRTQRQHRAAVAELRAVDLEKRAAKELDLGVRYSPSLDLEYYDPIAFCAIDAMHNLYLGTAKTFMKLLRDHNLLTNKNMMKIDGAIAGVQTGTDRSVGHREHEVKLGYFDCGRMAALDARILWVLCF